MNSDEKMKSILSVLHDRAYTIDNGKDEDHSVTFVQWEYGKVGLATYTVYDDGYSYLVTSNEAPDPVVAGLLTINFDRLCNVAEAMYQMLCRKYRDGELTEITKELESIGIELD